MGILKVSGKVLLIPLWFIVSIIGVGVKLLVHMVAIAKKILGFGIVVLFIGTVLCYQDWIQAAFLACMGGVLKFIVFAGEFIDAVMDLFRERICALILGDYEEKSVNKIFYDNDRRKTGMKSAFRLCFIYNSYKIACQERAGNPPVFLTFFIIPVSVPHT